MLCAGMHCRVHRYDHTIVKLKGNAIQIGLHINPARKHRESDMDFGILGMRWLFACILSLTQASNPLRVDLGYEDKTTHHRGRGSAVGPAIRGLHVRDDTRPAEYEMLRLHALRSIQSKSRLLQGDGFVSVSQHIARRSRDPPCAGHGCDRDSWFNADSHVLRGVSLGFRG